MPDGDSATLDARDGVLEGGGVALIVAEGAIEVGEVTVRPV